jgi:Ser/Thr protein kinase RdoA (MazF antagonist)
LAQPLTATLRAHLEAAYGMQVKALTELDAGTFRVDRDDGPSCIARRFPASRPLERVYGDAEILDGLEELGYPAERCADPSPVSVLDGEGVLITAYVPSVPRAQRRAAIGEAGGLRAVGELLARLDSIASPRPAFARDGGAWHHLTDGPPSAEIAAVSALLGETGRLVSGGGRALIDALRENVDELDGADGLPLGFSHPDLVVANVVASSGGGIVVVDWTGAGQAPRVWALAFLLWSVGYGGDLRRVERAVAGYRRRVRPEPEELARLAAVMRVRPLVLDTWSFCTGRKTLEQVSDAMRESRTRCDAIAARACEAFAS